MQARASSGWGRIVEGIGHPWSQRGNSEVAESGTPRATRASASEGGASCGSAAGPGENEEIVSLPVLGCSSYEHASSFSSFSVQTATRNIYHPDRKSTRLNSSHL